MSSSTAWLIAVLVNLVACCTSTAVSVGCCADGTVSHRVKRPARSLRTDLLAEASSWALIQDSALSDAIAPKAYGDPLAALKDIKFREALAQSFVVVSVAELFDKTWFVALLCSLTFGSQVAFWGCYIALMVHTVVAAGLGLVISRFFSVSALHFTTAGVFVVMATLYAYEWFHAESQTNALEGRSEDAREALPAAKDASIRHSWLSKFGQCFVSVFIAEWGDRTQIAMISLHSSLPVVPVCLGSLAAFGILTLSAVLVAAWIEKQKVSERMILGVSAVSFTIFALLAIVDGIREHGMQQLVS